MQRWFSRDCYNIVCCFFHDLAVVTGIMWVGGSQSRRYSEVTIGERENRGKFKHSKLTDNIRAIMDVLLLKKKIIR